MFLKFRFWGVWGGGCSPAAPSYPWERPCINIYEWTTLTKIKRQVPLSTAACHTQVASMNKQVVRLSKSQTFRTFVLSSWYTFRTFVLSSWYTFQSRRTTKTCTADPVHLKQTNTSAPQRQSSHWLGLHRTACPVFRMARLRSLPVSPTVCSLELCPPNPDFWTTMKITVCLVWHRVDW
jgi:hypothetical protein